MMGDDWQRLLNMLRNMGMIIEAADPISERITLRPAPVRPEQNEGWGSSR